jgi:DNA-binding NarL/FixJ family response regulator
VATEGAPAAEREPDVIEVLLADDERLVRAGFRAILDAETDIEVIAEAADGREALAMARALRPDVALLDIRMPGLDGPEAAERLLADRDHTRVMMVTTSTRRCAPAPAASC